MLDINLFPSHLRKKGKGWSFLKKFNIPVEMIIGLGAGVFILLIIVHTVLLVVNINRLARYKEFKKQWEDLLPSRQSVDIVLKELRELQRQHKAIEGITENEGISWSQKLNILSDNLPRGVWLRKVALNEKMLFVEGSAISKEKKQMINVHEFTANLKNHKKFLEDFTDLELGSIQSRRIKKVEIADFLITTKLK